MGRVENLFVFQKKRRGVSISTGPAARWPCHDPQVYVWLWYLAVPPSLGDIVVVGGTVVSPTASLALSGLREPWPGSLLPTPKGPCPAALA